VPWDYQDIVRRYLRPGCRVLDIGTGGERFLETMPLIGAGTGIDASPDMVAAARANTPAQLAGKVSFAVTPSERLELPDADFDLVLNRQQAQGAAAPRRPEPFDLGQAGDLGGGLGEEGGEAPQGLAGVPGAARPQDAGDLLQVTAHRANHGGSGAELLPGRQRRRAAADRALRTPG